MKVINIILIVMAILASIWFATDIFNYVSKTEIVSTKVLVDSLQQAKPNIMQKPDFDWTPVFSFLSAISIFFLKYLLYDRKSLKKKSETHNLNHSLFLNLERIDYNELPTIQLATEGKSILYRTMIKLQIDVIKNTVKEFLELNKEFENSLDFSNKVKKLILDISSKTTIKWNEHSVPKLVIDTYKELEYDRILILNNAVDNIALYAQEDWDVAIREVLNHVLTHVQLFITEDTLEVFSRLNGKLKGVYFQGVEL